jgi:hypothetical protein
MNHDYSLASIPGSQSVFDWFGFWPSFHDAEVTSIELHRQGISRIRVHCFSTTGRTNSRGHYVTEKHAIVTLLLEDITNMELSDFNNQNVLFSLRVQQKESFEVFLEGIYGVTGRIAAERLSLELKPGMPEGSMYSSETS